MTPDGATNGLIARVAVLESQQRDLRSDIRGLRNEDIRDIKNEVIQMRKEFQSSRVGMSRPEKIALSGVGITFVMAIIAAIALISQAPH